MKNKILVTGANGFIAEKIIDFLLGNGQNNIFGVDIGDRNDERIKFHQIDITDQNEVDNFFARYDDFNYIIHCAAIAHDGEKNNYEKLYEVNTEGARNVFSACSGLERLNKLIFFSSVDVYKNFGIKSPISERGLTSPKTNYGKTKLKAERHALQFNKKLGLPVAIFRMAPVYSVDNLVDIGKRVKLPKLETLVKVGSGDQKHTFCHVNNVCKVIDQVVSGDYKGDLTGEILNLGDDWAYKTRELVKFFKRVENKKCHIRLPKVGIRKVFYLMGKLNPSQKGIYKSYYWKLAENNLYSIKKAKDAKLMFNKNFKDILAGGKYEKNN